MKEKWMEEWMDGQSPQQRREMRRVVIGKKIDTQQLIRHIDTGHLEEREKTILRSSSDGSGREFLATVISTFSSNYLQF
jgi:hypothetical protein